MKQFIFIGVASVAVLVLGTLAANHYNQYQTKEQTTALQQAQAESNAAAEMQAKLESERVEMADAYNNLRVECEKGKASYDATSAFQKTQNQLQEPQCGTVLVLTQ